MGKKKQINRINQLSEKSAKRLNGKGIIIPNTRNREYSDWQKELYQVNGWKLKKNGNVSKHIIPSFK